MDLRLVQLRLTSIPPEIGQLQNLLGLSLNNNQIRDISPQIGGLLNLQELYILRSQNSLDRAIGEVAKASFLMIVGIGELPF